jgi:hypothetical protein
MYFALQRVQLLSGLSTDQFQKIADSVEEVKLRPGQVIFRKGEEGKVFYMIKEGNVYLSEIGENAQFSNHYIGPGDRFIKTCIITLISVPFLRSLDVLNIDYSSNVYLKSFHITIPYYFVMYTLFARLLSHQLR